MKAKKILSLILVVCVAIGAGIGVLALTATGLSLGDPDGDGSVTAADARLALRYAIDLDTDKSDEYVWACDVSASDGVTAEDARLILRYAIELEKAFKMISYSEAEVSGDGKVDDKGDKDDSESEEYYIAGKFKTSADTAYEPFVIAVKDGNVYASTKFEDIDVAIMKLGDELYLISNDREKYCIVDEASAAILDTLGLSAEEMTDALESLVDVVKKDEPSEVYETEKNGMTYLAKVYDEDDGGKTIIWYLNGALVAADLYGPDGNLDATIVFDGIADKVPDNLIVEPSEYGYTKVNFASFAVEMVSIKNADILALLDSLLNLKDAPEIGEEDVTVIGIDDIINSLVPDQFRETLDMITDAIPSDVDSLDESEILPGRLKEFIDMFPSDVDDLFDLIPSEISDPVVGFFDMIDGFAAALPDTVDGFADGLPDTIESYAGGIGDLIPGDDAGSIGELLTAADAGSDILDTIDGIAASIADSLPT